MRSKSNADVLRLAPDVGAPPESLAEQAFKALEEAITTLQLEPGSVVTEILLSKRFGVGLTPIRHALRRLSNQGLVVILARRGILIPSIDLSLQFKAIDVRREIERLVSGNAAEKAVPTQRLQFAAICKNLEKVAEENDGLSFLRLDQEFDEILFAAARNEWAEKCLRMIKPLMRRFWYFHYQQIADVPLAARVYGRVPHFIAEGDSQQSRAATDKKFEYIEAFTQATILD